jgi:hypothetical protein
VAQQKAQRNTVPRSLYTSAVADTLGPEMSPWCQNVRFRYGQINRAPGRSVPLQYYVFPHSILDFAVHTDAKGVETVFAIGWDDGVSKHAARPYDPDTRQFTVPYQFMCPDHYSGSVRISWTQGEERLFVATASRVSSINVTSPGVFTVEDLSSPPGVFVEYFSNRLFLLNTKDVVNRVQWTGRANYTDWETTTDHGGFLDLYDGKVEPITGGRILNNRLVVYRPSSLTDLVATGNDSQPFLPEGRVYGIGCLAPWSLASLGQFHIFLANDFNVYMWDGAKLSAIGTPIHNYIRQLYDPERSTIWNSHPFAVSFLAFKEYWLAMYDFLNNQMVVLIYDYQRDTWARDIFPAKLYAMLERTLIGAEGTDGYDRTGYPIRWPCLMAARERDYFMVDERVNGDRLSNPYTGAMEMFVETPDFYYGQDALQNGTMQRALVTQGKPRAATDPGYHFDLSVDRGNSWIESSKITPSDQHWGFEFIDFNTTSNVYRWRFRTIAPIPEWEGCHWNIGEWNTDNWATITAESAGLANKPSWRSYTSVYVPSGEFFPIERPVEPAIGRTAPPTERAVAKRRISPTGVEGG